jgi:hypothetical protein
MVPTQPRYPRCLDTDVSGSREEFWQCTHGEPLNLWVFFPFLSDQHKIQFFTWESTHTEMSWWKHFASEIPKLAELGVTQVWLPPPNKATSNVCSLSTYFLGAISN